MRTEKQMNRIRFLIIPITIVLIFATFYFCVTIYFLKHYYPRTMIAGIDCSYMTVQNVEKAFFKSEQEYELTITARDGITETISAGTVSMKYSIQEELATIQDGQNPFLWFYEIFKSHDYTLLSVVEYDEKEISEQVRGLSILSQDNMREPQNAYISDYLPDQKGYMVIEEDCGTVLLPETEELIVEAFLQKDAALNLEEQGLYRLPGISSENSRLNRLVEQMNRYTRANITYEFGDEKVILDGDTIHKWIYVRGGYVYLDKKAVMEYVRVLAKEHDTYYNKKEFITSEGEVKYLNSGYGWLMDVEAETEALLADLKEGKSVSREPVYLRRGEDFGKNNIAHSYVEIDLGQQHLYLYIERELVLETDFVSGCVVNGNATPEGIYDLDYKTKNVILRGPTWESYVYYWMPFNGAIGMHDATWRNHFGGEIYIHSGSHGCINLPYESAKELYHYVYAGIPVVCYY